MKRGYIVKITLFFYFYHVCTSIQPDTNLGRILYLSEINENEEVEIINEAGAMSASLFGTVQKYYCKVDIELESDFLLYGTKSWNFPSQDVTLKLDYPSNSYKNETIAHHDYILTELKVILYLDGDSSRGYITSGGMLQLVFFAPLGCIFMGGGKHLRSDFPSYLTAIYTGTKRKDLRHISMTFVFSNITSLSYQWYLYGVPPNHTYRTNHTAVNYLC